MCFAGLSTQGRNQHVSKIKCPGWCMQSNDYLVWFLSYLERKQSNLWYCWPRTSSLLIRVTGNLSTFRSFFNDFLLVILMWNVCLFWHQAVWVPVPLPIKEAVLKQNYDFRGGLHAASHAILNVVPL